MARSVLTELRCSLDLAAKLGVIDPKNVAHHKELKRAGHLLVRDAETGWPMFWPWISAEVPHQAAARSS